MAGSNRNRDSNSKKACLPLKSLSSTTGTMELTESQRLAANVAPNLTLMGETGGFLALPMRAFDHVASINTSFCPHLSLTLYRAARGCPFEDLKGWCHPHTFEDIFVVR